MTYAFLGEHTANEGRRIAAERARNGTAYGAAALAISHFYPVLPREYIILPPPSPSFSFPRHTPPVPLTGTNHSGSGSGTTNATIYAIQPPGPPPTASAEAHWDDDQHAATSRARPMFILQGNFGGKHAHRRNPR